MDSKRGHNQHSVTIQHSDGEYYSTDFTVESDVVTIHTEDGPMSTQVGSSGAEATARMLLTELIEAGKADPDQRH